MVIPCKEKDEYTVHLSAQGTSSFQGGIADFLGVPRHKVTVIVKRAGGGFGGKEGGVFGLMTTAAAQKFQRPVRLTMTSGQDMLMSGKRHEIRVDYKASVNVKGKIIDLEAKVYGGSGFSCDCSPILLQLTILRLDGGYTLPNFSADGFAFKTNTASNCAMRGFGGPEASVAIEAIMDHICHEFDFNPIGIRHACFGIFWFMALIFLYHL